MASNNISPIHPDVRVPTTPYRSFHEIQGEIMQWLAILNCACTALDQSGDIDRDDSASCARSAAHACDKHLNQLLNEMELWEMETRNAAPESAHSGKSE
jgi:hypothetical protein